MVFKRQSSVSGKFTMENYGRRSGNPNPLPGPPYWNKGYSKDLPNDMAYIPERTYLRPLKKNQWYCRQTARCGSKFGTCYQADTDAWGKTAATNVGAPGRSRQVCQTGRGSNLRPWGRPSVGFESL
jgi:hypothetical protein